MSTDDPNPSDLPPAVRETLDSLGGALGDIADLDKEQLNETIGLLETLGHDQAAGILRSRREVLKGAGAATGLGLAGLAGATATGGARAQSDTQTGTIGNGNQDADLQDVSAESVNTDSISVETWEWVDVTERGVDNTGSSSVASDIENLAQDDRLLIFPSGTYLLDRQVDLFEYDNFGILGRGDPTFKLSSTFDSSTVYDTRSNPVIRMQESESSTPTIRGNKMLAKGFEFDLSESPQLPDGDKYALCNMTVEEQGRIEDITLPPTDRQVNGPRVHPLNTDGIGFVVNVDIEQTTTRPGGTGIGASFGSGTLIVKGCRYEGFPDNGMYLIADFSQLVIGCSVVNCGNSCIRFGGASPSIAINCRIDQDDNYHTEQQVDGGPKGAPARILWADNGAGKAKFENVDVTARNKQSDGPYVSPGATAPTFEDCTFRLVDAQTGSTQSGEPDGPATFRGCRWTVEGTFGDGEVLRTNAGHWQFDSCSFVDNIANSELFWLFAGSDNDHTDVNGGEIKGYGRVVFNFSDYDISLRGTTVYQVDDTADIVNGQTVDKVNVAERTWSG